MSMRTTIEQQLQAVNTKLQQPQYVSAPQLRVLRKAKKKLKAQLQALLQAEQRQQQQTGQLNINL